MLGERTGDKILAEAEGEGWGWLAMTDYQY